MHSNKDTVITCKFISINTVGCRFIGSFKCALEKRYLKDTALKPSKDIQILNRYTLTENINT